MWPPETVDRALALVTLGHTPRSAASLLGVPRRTISDWLNSTAELPSAGGPGTGSPPDPHLQPAPYAYLLGLYLGDGCISLHPNGVWRLRIFCDAQYPEIIDACARAMQAVLPNNRAGRYRRLDSACVEVSMSSRHWPELIPQHGPGRKHDRVIALTDWQRRIVDEQRSAFLRGLIHSDGCRYIARQRCNGRLYEWPRYCFSNRSENIKTLFCETCDALGIQWRRAEPKHVYINRREAVALVDKLVGPKR